MKEFALREMSKKKDSHNLIDQILLFLNFFQTMMPNDLREKVLDYYVTTFGFPYIECLCVTKDGGSLSCGKSTYSFALDDKENPYSQVIKCGKPLRISLKEARTKYPHPGFLQQLLPHNSDLFLEIRPLRNPKKYDAILGVILIIGSCSLIESFVYNKAYSDLEIVICEQWHSLINAKERRDSFAPLRRSATSKNEYYQENRHLSAINAMLIGKSEAVKRIRRQVCRAADTNLSVLLQGETGSGKDLVARAIHECSRRRGKEFMAINCAAIPDALLESELFGYSKGAFSGADKDRLGLIGKANGGTLFLDEIGDMPLYLQVKLLRVLESGCYRPLGAADEVRSDFRVIAATHQPLDDLIEKQRFRKDLFYRLSQFPITIAPLRERKDDIPMLIESFINEFGVREQRIVPKISAEGIKVLGKWDYPGNLRELKNILDFACAVTPENEVIDVALLDKKVNGSSWDRAEVHKPDTVKNLREAVEVYEAEIIRRRLALFDGNLAKAADSLGVPRRTLAYKARRMKIGVEINGNRKSI